MNKPLQVFSTVCIAMFCFMLQTGMLVAQTISIEGEPSEQKPLTPDSLGLIKAKVTLNTQDNKKYRLSIATMPDPLKNKGWIYDKKQEQELITNGGVLLSNGDSIEISFQLDNEHKGATDAEVVLKLSGQSGGEVSKSSIYLNSESLDSKWSIEIGGGDIITIDTIVIREKWEESYALQKTTENTEIVCENCENSPYSVKHEKGTDSISINISLKEEHTIEKPTGKDSPPKRVLKESFKSFKLIDQSTSHVITLTPNIAHIEDESKPGWSFPSFNLDLPWLLWVLFGFITVVTLGAFVFFVIKGIKIYKRYRRREKPVAYYLALKKIANSLPHQGVQFWEKLSEEDIEKFETLREKLQKQGSKESANAIKAIKELGLANNKNGIVEEARKLKNKIENINLSDAKYNDKQATLPEKIYAISQELRILQDASNKLEEAKGIAKSKTEELTTVNERLAALIEEKTRLDKKAENLEKELERLFEISESSNTDDAVETIRLAISQGEVLERVWQAGDFREKLSVANSLDLFKIQELLEQKLSTGGAADVPLYIKTFENLCYEISEAAGNMQAKVSASSFFANHLKMVAEGANGKRGFKQALNHITDRQKDGAFFKSMQVQRVDDYHTIEKHDFYYRFVEKYIMEINSLLILKSYAEAEKIGGFSLHSLMEQDGINPEKFKELGGQIAIALEELGQKVLLPQIFTDTFSKEHHDEIDRSDLRDKILNTERGYEQLSAQTIIDVQMIGIERNDPVKKGQIIKPKVVYKYL